MFGKVRAWSGALLAAVQRVAEASEAACAALSLGGGDGVSARLDELERRQALWEAEVEGELAKAVSERKNARNAEERTRVMVAKLGPDEGGEDGEDELPEEYRRLLQGGDGGGGAEDGLQPVPAGLGVSREDRKAAARAFKFGG